MLLTMLMLTMVNQCRKPASASIIRNKQSTSISQSYVKLRFTQKKNTPGNFFQSQICSTINQSITVNL